MLIPGQNNQCLVVGGSEDPECFKCLKKVRLISVNEAGKCEVIEKKPVNLARAKIGLCGGQLKSELNASFVKNYIFAFGGQSASHGGTLRALKTVEQYTPKANIW